MSETINHPEHYGGADNPYEAIKVIEAWGLGFHLGNAVKYISRAGKKGPETEDIDKAIWYLERYRDGLCGHEDEEDTEDREPATAVPRPGEVLRLRHVHTRDFFACYAHAENGDGEKKNVRLVMSQSQDFPRAGDRVTVGEEGFTYIEKAERGDA